MWLRSELLLEFQQVQQLWDIPAAEVNPIISTLCNNSSASPLKSRYINVQPSLCWFSAVHVGAAVSVRLTKS